MTGDVGHVDVGAVGGDGPGRVETRGGPGPIGTADRFRAPCKGTDLAGWGNFPNRAVARVGDIQVAGCVDGNPRGIVQARRSTIAVGGTGLTGQAREGTHRTGLGNLANRVVAAVGDVDVARGIDSHSIRAEEPGRGARAVKISGAGGMARQQRKVALRAVWDRAAAAGEHQHRRHDDSTGIQNAHPSHHVPPLEVRRRMVLRVPSVSLQGPERETPTQWVGVCPGA